MYSSPLCEVLFFLMCNSIKRDSIITDGDNVH